jgi:hypothetical protein
MQKDSQTSLPTTIDWTTIVANSAQPCFWFGLA